jgi:hypothetical protein
VSGEVFSAAGGLYARFFIGLTPGYYQKDATVEDIRDHWADIRDPDGFIIPEGPNDELQKIFGILSEGREGKVGSDGKVA